MNPLVSILIPAYNSQQWIADAIESAVAQSWPKKEIIVVDDGSTDQTLCVARQFASRGVHVVTHLNQGASAARNAAFAMCQGDYIQWLDADDLLDPGKVENHVRMIGECRSSRTLLSGAWGSFMSRTRKAQFSPTQLWRDLGPVEWMVTKMGQNLHMQTSNWLVSRELLAAAGPWDTRLSFDDDGEYLCRVVLASDGIQFFPEARSYYRRVGFNSMTYIGGSAKKLESLFLSITLHIRHLRSAEDSGRTRSACVKFIRVWLPEFYPYRIDLVEELKRMASELGESVEVPPLPWKYNWIARMFGTGAGRRAQMLLPRIKEAGMIAWDRAMFRLE
jgi:glycosyltransferase involved in cell wall biosynthesis